MVGGVWGALRWGLRYKTLKPPLYMGTYRIMFTMLGSGFAASALTLWRVSKSMPERVGSELFPLGATAGLWGYFTVFPYTIPAFVLSSGTYAAGLENTDSYDEMQPYYLRGTGEDNK